ncbi:MAG: hypothetical protein WA317_03790 [Mycobacterium sp.]|uniref:hypothetical protein n=1 Tax=Mycobacterium sp. TaxID=1785 RepID=UPI003CC57F93
MSKREQEGSQFNNNGSATAFLGPEGRAMLPVSDHVGEALYAIETAVIAGWLTGCGA